jgi:hypothetical protein
MAVGTIMPLPRFTGFDANGNPVAGGQLFTFIAGTSTPVATYSDVGLTVAHANPIILNSAGRPSNGTSELGIYLTPGSSYKFVLQTATGATVWTQDNVAAVPIASQTVDVIGTAGEALPASNAVYLSVGARGKTAGQWFLTDADFPDASSLANTVGMTLAAIPLGAQGSIRTQGTIAFAGAPLTPGAIVYASTTAGAIVNTPPSNTRAIGQALDVATLLLGAVPLGAYTVIGNTQTGAINDWAPGLQGNTVITWSGTADATITGLAGGSNGQIVLVKNRSASNVLYLPHLSASSAAANRWANMTTSGSTPIAPGGAGLFYYEGANGLWVLTLHDQGAWVTVPYSAAIFTGSGGMTWTVDAGDVVTYRYRLQGRTLQVQFYFNTTSVGGTLSNVLQAALPFAAAGGQLLAPVVVTEAAIQGLGTITIAPPNGSLLLQKLNGATWAAATNATAVSGAATFEVS